MFIQFLCMVFRTHILWNIETKWHSVFLELHYFTLIRKKNRQKQSSGHRLNCIFMNTVGTDNQMKRSLSRNVSLSYLIRERCKIYPVCAVQAHTTLLSLIWEVHLHSGLIHPKYMDWSTTHWHSFISVFKTR